MNLKGFKTTESLSGSQTTTWEMFKRYQTWSFPILGEWHNDAGLMKAIGRQKQNQWPLIRGKINISNILKWGESHRVKLCRSHIRSATNHYLPPRITWDFPSLQYWRSLYFLGITNFDLLYLEAHSAKCSFLHILKAMLRKFLFHSELSISP